MSLAVAQESIPESTNLVHSRHHHPRNPDHPTVPADGSRFVTSRASQIVLPLPEEQDAFTFVVFGDRTGGPASGGGLEQAAPTRMWFTKHVKSAHHDCFATVHGDTIEFSAYDTEGVLFDRFTLTKQTE